MCALVTLSVDDVAPLKHAFQNNVNNLNKTDQRIFNDPPSHAPANLDCVSMYGYLKEVLEREIHRLPILELVLELYSLPGHLDANKDTYDRVRQVLDERVRKEQFLPVHTG